MKVRIVREVAWETDRMLNRFKIGDTYDLPQTIATYMILSGSAIAVEPTHPAMDNAESENSALIDELRQMRTVRKTALKPDKKP